MTNRMMPSPETAARIPNCLKCRPSVGAGGSGGGFFDEETGTCRLLTPPSPKKLVTLLSSCPASPRRRVLASLRRFYPWMERPAAEDAFQQLAVRLWARADEPLRTPTLTDERIFDGNYFPFLASARPPRRASVSIDDPAAAPMLPSVRGEPSDVSLRARSIGALAFLRRNRPVDHEMMLETIQGVFDDEVWARRLGVSAPKVSKLHARARWRFACLMFDGPRLRFEATPPLTRAAQIQVAWRFSHVRDPAGFDLGTDDARRTLGEHFNKPTRPEWSALNASGVELTIEFLGEEGRLGPDESKRHAQGFRNALIPARENGSTPSEVA